MIRLQKLSLRSRLFLGFGTVTALALLIAGSGIYALRKIRLNAQEMIQHVDHRIQTQVSQSEYTTRIRQAIEAVVHAKSMGELERAEKMTSELPTLVLHNDEDQPWQLNKTTTHLAAIKRKHLSNTHQLDLQDRQVTLELDRIVTAIDHMAEKSTSDSLSLLESSITAVHDDAIVEANNVSQQFTRVTLVVDEAISAMQAVLNVRSFSYELSSLLNRVLQTDDSAVVIYSQKQLDAIFGNINSELSAISRQTNRPLMDQSMSQLINLIPKLISRRKNNLERAHPLHGRDREMDSLQQQIKGLLGDIGSGAAQMVDDIYFESIVTLETTMEEGHARSRANMASLERVFKEINKSMQRAMTTMQTAWTARSDVHDLGMMTKDMLLCQDRALLEDRRIRLDGLFTDIHGQLEKLSQQEDTGTILASIEQLQNLTHDLIGAKNQVFTTHEQLETGLLALTQTLAEVNRAISDKARNLKEDVHREMAQNIHLVKHWSMVIVIISMGLLSLALGITLRYPQSISRSLSAVLKYLQGISQGDLSQSLTLDRQDEIGLLAQHVNDMVIHLRTILQRVHHVADQITETGGEMGVNSSQQVQGMSHQSERVHETSAAATQLSQTSEHIGGNIKSVSDIAEFVFEGMTNIRQATHQTNDMLKDLSAKSIEIRKMTDVINNVADQTNLLAVNAAIEAARAGEHGRGFAVVADQIGKLADSTAGSTRDITAIVDQIQQEMSGITSAMERSLEDVEKEMQLASDSAGRAKEIAVSANEQISGTRSISEAMTDINDTMSQIVAKAEHTAEAAVRLTTLADDLKDIMTHFTIATD